MNNKIRSSTSRFVAISVSIALISGIGFAIFSYRKRSETKSTSEGLTKSKYENKAITQDLYENPKVVEGERKIFSMEHEARELIRAKKWDEAETLYCQIFESPFGPSKSWMYADLAEVQYQKGKYEESLESMKKAFFGQYRGLESDALLLVRFAEVAERCGDSQLATKIWQQASVIAKQSVNLDIKEAASNSKLTASEAKALVLVEAGQKAFAKDDHERMRELNLKALEYDPKCAMAHLNIGKLQGNTAESLFHMEQASKYGTPSIRNFTKNEIDVRKYFLNRKVNF